MPVTSGQIVDAFRFPSSIANEDQLFRWSPEKLSLDSKMGTENKVTHNCYALFDNSEEALLQWKNSTWRDSSWLSLLAISAATGFHQLDTIKTLGFKGVVLHPYLQNIDEKKIHVVIELCRQASQLGLLIVVCTAYGGTALYDIQPLRIAQRIADIVTTPLILSHAGGAKVLDAMLLAEAYPHLLLDTSYSLSYWLGSSVEQDFAFAMKKLGCQRWLFGSDAPFLSQQDAIRDHMLFFKRHSFSETEIDQIMWRNSKQLYEV